MTPMNFCRLTRLALAVLGAQPVHAHSQDNQGNKTMEQAQIQSAIDANNRAVSARDIEAILATYEPGAVMAVQPGMIVEGSQALREGFKQFLAIDPELTVTSHEIIQAGDIALHSYTWKMSGKAPDGAVIEQGGLSVVVLRKQPDGRWLMVIDNPFGDHLMHRN